MPPLPRLWILVAAMTLAGGHAAAADAAARPEAVVFSPLPPQYAGYEHLGFWIAGRWGWIALPKEPRADRPWVWRPRYNEFARETDVRLLEAGFHVVWVDLPYLLGAPAELDAMDAVYETLVRERGLGPRPVLRSISRGHVTALLWADRHPERVSCIVGLTPVCDLASWPAGTKAGLRDEASAKIVLETRGIDTFTGPVPGNPLDRLERCARAGVPMLHVATPADEVVPYAENTEPLAERYRALGGPVTVLLKRADGSALGTDEGITAAVKGAHLKVGTTGDPDAETAFILRHAAAPAGPGARER